MKCPVCKTTELRLIGLEENLSSFKCSSCGGNWVQGLEYWKWLEQHGKNLPEVKNPGGDLPVSDTPYTKECPECRWNMTRYRVGHGVGFSLDQCAGCKGIWFDRNEWEVLKGRNLHDDIHSIFTTFWQSEAVKEERKGHLEQIYNKKFGADDYSELKRVRAWLDAHPKKQELLAYLIDQNPFGV